MIGIFDSGLGGLSLYLEAKKQIPDKGFVYLSDRKNFPYGTKDQREIFEISKANVELLIHYGAKVVLIACNSATVSSISSLRKFFDIPIVGVEPGIKVAKGKKDVIVWGTSRTIESYQENGRVLARAEQLDSLVGAIEKCFPLSKEEIMGFTKEKVGNPGSTVILGCTHYHLIKKDLESIYPNIYFIAPENAIIKQLKKFERFATGGSDIFLTSGDIGDFSKKAELILGRKINVRGI